MATVIVSGALANKPSNGGGVWERLSWVSGLRRLGVDVYFVEQLARQTCVDANGAITRFADCINLDWFRSATESFGIADRSALVYGHECAGLSWPALIDLAKSADLLVNLSGHLTLPELVDRVRRKAYIDVDPGFTQFWHADAASAFKLGGHEFYFTIGENIGGPDCPIPTGGIEWRPIRQPIVLDDWPVTPANDRGLFSTIASWRGPFGAIEYQGRKLGLKCHEFRKFVELPSPGGRGSLRNATEGVPERSVPCALFPVPSFEIALAIHPADDKDLRALIEHGWRIVEPRAVAGDAEAFRRYVQQSAAEFSVAQGVYVDTNSGWFSDRTVRYLASGKPALVQETGFSRQLPSGEGVVAFRTLDEAVEGAERIMHDYDSHCQAARAIAEKYFDSDKVLGKMLEEVGL
jgi:hypothetical protein